MTIKAHEAFKYIRADEVAECWDGVPRDLYARLWNDIVPLQRPIPNLEDSGPADHVGHENLAAHWHLLSEADQLLLNGLAAKEDAEFEALRNAPRLGDDTDSCGADDGNAFLADLGNIESELESDPPQAADFEARAPLATAADAQAYMLGGKACVTLVSEKTGARFTYRISASPDGQAYFVGLLSGPDNTSDYKYMGRIARGIFWAGRKVPRPGDIGRDAPSARAFDYAWRALAQGAMPVSCQIWHEGRCGRCGRKLTVPESVERGFGPECAGKL